MSDFIDNFPFSSEVKGRLRSLGADSPAALLAALEAAGSAAVLFLGRRTLLRVRRLLRNSLSASDRRVFARPVLRHGLGAQLKVPFPGLQSPSFDIKERDRLYARLQTLRQIMGSGRNSSTAQAEVQRLENRLNHMLEDKTGTWM